MDPRPDHPADPSPDGDGDPAERAGSGDDGRVSDETWAAIVADLRGDPDPTGTTGPEGPAPGGPAGTTTGGTGRDDPRGSSGPAVTYPVAPWVTDSRVVRPARRGDDATGAGSPAAGPGREVVGASGRDDRDATDRMDAAEREVDEAEHFRAPDPGPVLGGDPLLTMAWLAVVGMPLLALVVVIAWRDAPSVLLQASGVVFLLGLGVLLWRMPRRREDVPHDPDDGAVV